MPCMGPTSRESLVKSIADKIYQNLDNIKDKAKIHLWCLIERSIYEARQEYYNTSVSKYDNDSRELLCMILGILNTIPDCSKDKFIRVLNETEHDLACIDF